MSELSLFSKKGEKKVEYLELIYDLIFVYIIGKNNSILHHTENGFVSWQTFLTYVLCTLAVIQIWNYSTFHINLYGRNSVRDHVFLFINMYLLYHMAVGISANGYSSFYRFNIAWALLLINLGIQCLIECSYHKEIIWERKYLFQKATILFTQAALVGLNIACYAVWNVSIMYVPIIFGIIANAISAKRDSMVPVDFAHLSERAMLYVVFTFGEMVISIVSYFSDGLSLSSFYFSTMAFLIVVSLLVSYGTFYNRILDREAHTNGSAYMTIHVFLVFALNNISVSLEFMREDRVSVLPKTLFLTGSFLLYFICLFSLGRYANKDCRIKKSFYPIAAAVILAFFALMIVLRNYMYLNIALTVVFVFGVYYFIYTEAKKHK